MPESWDGRRLTRRGDAAAPRRHLAASSTTPTPAAREQERASTANAIVEAPVLLRPLVSAASTLPFGLGLTAGFCGSGLVDGSCGPGFRHRPSPRAFRAACSAASASATWAESPRLVGGDLLRSVEGGLNASQPDSYLSSVSFSAAAIALFSVVLSAALTSLRGLGVLGVLERHRERGLADLRERLRVIHNGTIGVNRGNLLPKGLKA